MSGTRDTLDEDLETIKPGVTARVGAGLVMLGGSVAVLLSVQMILFVGVAGAWAALPWSIGVIGIGCIALGVFMGKARLWAAVSGSVLALVLVACTIAWLVVSVSSGLFTCYTFISVMASCLSAIGALLAIGPCMKATRARARLRARGVETGM